MEYDPIQKTYPPFYPSYWLQNTSYYLAEPMFEKGLQETDLR